MTRILTDIHEPRSNSAWHQQAEFDSRILGGKGFKDDLGAICRLWRLSRRYDVLVLKGSRKSSLFTIFYGLIPMPKKPVLLIDCLWYKPKGRLALLLKRIQFRLMSRSVHRFVVWASHEVDSYAGVFLLPREKLSYIPHHHTLEGYEFQTVSGDYIFSGGDGDRDYATLLAAVKGLGVKVLIATRRLDWNEGAEILPEVKATPVSPDEFRRLMAGAKMVVVPMKSGLLHSGGQQTYLNAMAMGKVVIAADDLGARDYITHGIDGLIVPAGDPKALGKALRFVLDDPELGRVLQKNAREIYDRYSTARCMDEILRCALELAKK